MKKIKVLLFCILAALANFLLNILVEDVFRLSLFLDTVFTCAAAFAAGTLPGIFTAVLTTFLNCTFRYSSGWWNYLYVLCPIAEVLLIRLFRALRREPGDQKPLISTASALLLLYISMCMVTSLLGGLIDFAITTVLEISDYAVYPHTFFKLGLVRNRLPLLAVDILSRIPVNIVDRFIVVFGGYGLALLSRRLLRTR